jgi:hypothetical protein
MAWPDAASGDHGQGEGHEQNIQIDDMAKAADVVGFAGKRKYPPGDTAASRHGGCVVSPKAGSTGPSAFEPGLKMRACAA